MSEEQIGNIRELADYVEYRFDSIDERLEEVADRLSACLSDTQEICEINYGLDSLKTELNKILEEFKPPKSKLDLPQSYRHF